MPALRLESVLAKYTGYQVLRYLHHNKLVEVPSHPADLTVLDHLRECQQQCGTKEGCATGDCGACTIVIAEASLDAEGNDKLLYKSANSCITFVGSLHGKQLITVENLQDATMLHPSQQAMVDCHGSQCGFCTPGIVMSLFAAMKTDACQPATRLKIDEQLGGNLCRCTGYRPIVDAAQQALQQSEDSDHFDNNAASTIAKLRSIASHDKSVDFFRPETVAKLCELRQNYPAAKLLAGGTDLALSVTQRLEDIDKIIMIGALDELNFFTATATELRVGAGLCLTEFRQKIVEFCPELEALLVRFGGTQVRNQATIGGNFANASPVGDLPPVFIALNASVILQSTRGERAVTAAEFFTAYKKTLLESDEFIREFRIPVSSFRHPDKSVSVINRFYKKTLVGRTLDEQCIKDAQAALKQDFQPIDDVRASAEYRNLVCENLLVRLATEINSPDIATTVTAHDF